MSELQKELQGLMAGAGIRATQAQAKEVLDAFWPRLIAVTDGSDNQRLIVRGFGTFSIKETAAREGRNPKNGEKLTIPAKTVLRFKGRELG